MEDLFVGKSVLQAFKIKTWAIDAKGSGPFVFIVEDGSRKELGELSDIIV